MFFLACVRFYFGTCALQVNKNYSYAMLWLFGSRPKHLGVKIKLEMKIFVPHPHSECHGSKTLRHSPIMNLDLQWDLTNTHMFVKWKTIVRAYIREIFFKADLMPCQVYILQPRDNKYYHFFHYVDPFVCFLPFAKSLQRRRGVHHSWYLVSPE